MELFVLMNYFAFIEKKKKAQQAILKFIEEERHIEENFENLLEVIKEEQISNNSTEFKIFLYLICKISENHFRRSTFNNKIYKIIKYYLNEIQEKFSNEEIFHIFKKNKLLLLFLTENKILYFNQIILSIIRDNYFKKRGYEQYFYPEIKNHTNVKKNEKSVPNDFNDKRKKGENDSEISELIRSDKIEEFIIYIDKNGYSLNSNIQISDFETNPLLMKSEPSLIEYSAFFGSIQIFKYLYLNNATVMPKIWIYAIHGDHPEMIHILEENNIVPEDKNYAKCFLESIKCFHISTSNYIRDNYIQNEDPNSAINFSEFQKRVVSTSFKYHNYFFFPDNIDQIIIFYFACQFDYINIVEYFIKNKKIDVFNRIILTLKLK